MTLMLSFPIPQVLKSKEASPPNFYYKNFKQKICKNNKVAHTHNLVSSVINISPYLISLPIYLSSIYPSHLSYAARTAMTKYCKMGGLNKRILFSPIVKFIAIHLCPHMIFSLCMCTPPVSFSARKDISLI